MKKYELISSLIWTAVGVLFLVGSTGLGLGSLSEPGPGFFPFIVAACLTGFSLLHFIFSLIKGGQFDLVKKERFWPKGDGFKRISFVIVCLFGFVFALNYLGFGVITLLFMLVTLRFIEDQKWLTVFSVGGLTTALCYALFQVWLRSNLPTGVLGF